MDKYLLEFIKESNKIEGIKSYDEEAQVFSYKEFLDNEKTVPNLQDFAFNLYKSSFDSAGKAPLVRSTPGQDVYVGNHTPPKGGPHLESILKSHLKAVRSEIDSKNAYSLHQEYEALHPLTDCNGRTGRAIWAYLMMEDGYDLRIGFLHKWYYQSLDKGRP